MEEFDIINISEYNKVNNEYLVSEEYEYIDEKKDDSEEFYNEIEMDKSEENNKRSESSKSDSTSEAGSSGGGTASSNSITLHGVSAMSTAVSAIAVCAAASGVSYYSGDKEININPQNEYVEMYHKEDVYPDIVIHTEEVYPEVQEEKKEIIVKLPEDEKKNNDGIIKKMDVSSHDYDGIYDGVGHTGMLVNIPEGADVTYGEERDSINLDNAPEYTDSGKHTVYYMVKKDGYETYIGSYIVTIEKKIVIPPVPELIAGTYNGRMQIPLFQNSEDYICSGELSGIDAGKYEMKISLPDYKNYEWSDGNLYDKTVTWIIKPRMLSLEWQEKNHFEYNGQFHTIYVTLGNVVPGDFLEYTIHGNREQNPGIYKAEITSFKGSNNYILPEKCSYRWSINIEDNVIIENDD